MKNFILFLVSILIFGVLGLGWLAKDDIRSYMQRSDSVDTVNIRIAPGQNTRMIAATLHQKSVIHSPLLFELYVRIRGRERFLKPGHYLFERPSRLDLVVRKLEDGAIILHKLTIPEGANLKEITSYLRQNPICEPQAFEAALQDENLKQTLGVPGVSFEGFLYPETYFFAENSPPDQLIKKMVGEFFQRIRPADIQRAQAMGFSLYDWVTLASIIEKESSHPEEHALIASVFHNRLKLGMRLQSDPTVIYGIEDYRGNITKKHLTTPTPYNTYTMKGLPLGPIANPSHSALMAVLNPAQTEYLYFVANKSGRHIFSKDYDAHRKAVQKYQIP